MNRCTTGLDTIGLDAVPSDYFRGKSSYRFRFHILEDIVKAGPASALHEENGHLDLVSLYKGTDRLTLYVDVPWCFETCTYCYYWGKAEGRKKMQLLMDAEIAHSRNMEELLASEQRVYPSIYFGGGTPSVLPANLLQTVLSEFVGRYAEPGLTEVCSEASINSLTPEKTAILENYVTRLSLGVQSFSDRLLNAVARSFDASRAIDMLQELVPRFDSVNIDLIFGLQNQTMDDWLQTIETAISLQVPSISIYRLEIRTTPLMEEYKKDPDSFPDEVTCQMMRFSAQARLNQAGYEENLVGWFLKPSVRDTVVYRERWQKQTPCIAFGPGVHNYGADHFYYNANHRDTYIAGVGNGEFPIDGFYRLTARKQLLWFALAQWKSNAPLDLGASSSRFGDDVCDEFRMRLDKFCDWELLSVQDDRYSVTEGGKGAVEWVLQELIEDWLGANSADCLAGNRRRDGTL